MKAEGLHKHHVGELLRDERAAGLRIMQLFFHTIEGPAHGRAVRLFTDMNDRRKRLEEHVCVGASKDEVTTDEGHRGPGQRSWEDRPRPKVAAATDAIVRMTTTTICGTDLHILKGDLPAVESGRVLGAAHA